MWAPGLLFREAFSTMEELTHWIQADGNACRGGNRQRWPPGGLNNIQRFSNAACAPDRMADRRFPSRLRPDRKRRRRKRRVIGMPVPFHGAMEAEPFLFPFIVAQFRREQDTPRTGISPPKNEHGIFFSGRPHEVSRKNTFRGRRNAAAIRRWLRYRKSFMSSAITANSLSAGIAVIFGILLPVQMHRPA
jgi:hypothetical protein